MEKLYDITFPISADKAQLYFNGFYKKREDGSIRINNGYYLDLGTYFNAFSLKKWRSYTTIEKLKITLNLSGNVNVELYGMNSEGEEVFRSEQCSGKIEFTISLAEIEAKFDFDLLAVRLNALSDDATFHSGEYSALFSTIHEVKLGLTICTFKREKYLLPNLERLKTLTDRNPDINVMVVDNGSTLEETQTDSLQIIHNPNFGGAGGFTRGLMEQVNKSRNSHVILMDDDVVIELSAIDRLYYILRHLKPEHEEKFFGGAMLILDKPTIQHENTACFNKIIRKSFGHNFELSDKNILCENENSPNYANTYAAWWFCCIPIERVKKIGYPLPIFIKCDDMEYSFRNQQEILTMNGVSVWHEAFENKANLIMGYYFGNRNTLLINHFAENCGKLTFAVAVLGRIAKSLLKLNFDGLRMLELALKDLNTGFEGMTSIRADEKYDSLKKYPLTKNTFNVIFSIIKLAAAHCINYDKLDAEYKNFRSEKLANQKFWRQYLDI